MRLFDFRPKTTPSQLAQMTRCEQQMLFKRKQGDKQTAKSAAATRQGTKIHRQLETRGEGFLNGGQQQKSGCFIATAVYGDQASQTCTLREFRDSVLLKSKGGKIFVNSYYTFSPAVAKMLNALPFLKPVVRLFLWPIVEWVKKCRS
jgi:hypothetical protein